MTMTTQQLNNLSLEEKHYRDALQQIFNVLTDERFSDSAEKKLICINGVLEGLRENLDNKSLNRQH